MCFPVVALFFFALVFIQKGGGGISGNRVHLLFFLFDVKKRWIHLICKTIIHSFNCNHTNLGNPF